MPRWAGRAMDWKTKPLILPTTLRLMTTPAQRLLHHSEPHHTGYLLHYHMPTAQNGQHQLARPSEPWDWRGSGRAMDCKRMEPAITGMPDATCSPGTITC